MPSTCQGDIGLSALIPLSNALSVAPTLNTIVHFVNLASRLKDDILLTQPAFVSPLQPPSTLPPSARQFLSDACGLPPPDIDCCWDTLKGVIWEPLNLPQDRVERDFTNYGHSRGFSTSVASHFITHICSFHVSITNKTMLEQNDDATGGHWVNLGWNKAMRLSKKLGLVHSRTNSPS
jgi:hypothetical protein